MVNLRDFPKRKSPLLRLVTTRKPSFKLVLIRFVKSKFTSRILHQNARPSSWEGSFSCHFCPDIRSHGSIDPPVKTIYHSTYIQLSSFKSPNVLLKFDRQKWRLSQIEQYTPSNPQKYTRRKDRCIAAIKTIPGGLVKLIYCDVWGKKIWWTGVFWSVFSNSHIGIGCFWGLRKNMMIQLLLILNSKPDIQATVER